jgi:hypothetical protein
VSFWIKAKGTILRRLLGSHDRRIFEYIWSDTDLRDDAVDSLLGRDAASVDSLLERESVLLALKRRVLSNDGHYERFMEHAAQVGYRLPAVVVSFPRSGSNFLQNLLELSTGLRNRTLYHHPKIPLRELLSVKSHAPSREHLRDELRRRVPDLEGEPERVVRLCRDPRSVAISFYEFVQARKQISIAQEDFLDTCYYFATYLDGDGALSRQTEPKALSVADAWSSHANAFFAADAPGLRVTYEDLVNSPEDTLTAVLEYLEVSSPVDLAGVQEKVAQYSSPQQNRASVDGWKVERDKYSVLLGSLTQRLGPLFASLGYEMSE